MSGLVGCAKSNTLFPKIHSPPASLWSKTFLNTDGVGGEGAGQLTCKKGETLKQNFPLFTTKKGENFYLKFSLEASFYKNMRVRSCPFSSPTACI